MLVPALNLLAMPAWAESLASMAPVQASGAVVAALLAAYVAEFVMQRVLLRLAKHTSTQLDDKIVEILRRPVFLSVLFGGLAYATQLLQPSTKILWLVTASLECLATIIWATAAFRIGSLLLTTIAGAPKSAMIRPASLPVFLIFFRVALIIVSMYFVFLAWDIDLTAWLASAGILGIAVGFAAKDTLANLFAGVFILADAPYRLGDMIVIDGNLRGKVVRVGMRSTRLLTRDDVEVTIPNSIMGNATVLNEAGGPQMAQRIRVKVFAAYGCDVPVVKSLLRSCADGVEFVLADPQPEVRLRELGESGLRFELLVWVGDSTKRGRVLDALTTNAYNAMNAAAIEIPYNKLDVYVKDAKVKRAAPAAAQ